MNTAPKLKHIEVLRQMRADFSDCIGLKEEVDALDYALSAASTSWAFNASVYKTAEELAAYLESLYEVNGDGSFTGRKWDVAQRAAIAVMGVTPTWIDAKALEVARRFTQDIETQRRASLQAEISEAMQHAALAPPSGEGVDTRVAFERWVAKRWGCANDKWADSGEYRYDDTRNWWQCWQAAISNTTPQSAPVDVNSPQYEAGFKAGLAFEAEHRLFTTPQSTPVDVIGHDEVVVHREILENADAALAISNHKGSAWSEHESPRYEIRELLGLPYEKRTTPPPASQERGGDSIVLDAYQLRCAGEFAAPDYEQDEGQRGTELIFQSLPERIIDGETLPSGMYCWYADYPEEGVMHLEEYEEYEARMTKAASPPSSAAEENVSEGSVAQSVEHVKEAQLTGRTPGRRVADGRGFESRQSPPVDAAEQAKPASMYGLVNAEQAQAGEVGSQQAQVGDIGFDDCPSCGQPQAGELPPRCAAARTLSNETLVEVALQAAGRASLIDSETHRSRYSECRTELLRRLAGGVTVDDVMVERAIIGAMAQARRDGVAMGDQRWDGSFPTRTMWRAALVAASGAK